MLYSINGPNLITWLPLLLEILGNMYIAVISFPVCEVTNFESNILIKLSPEKLGQNILRAKSAFNAKLKAFSVIFKGI